MSTRAPEREDAAAEVLRVPFGLLRAVRGPEGHLRRLRAEEVDGRRTWRFDLVHDVHDLGANDTVATTYSAGIAALGVRVDGRIGLERKGPLRNPQPLGVPLLDDPPAELARLFVVRAGDPALARDLLDERTVAWLTGPGRGFHFEIVHDRVLAYGRRRLLGGGADLRAAIGLAECVEAAAR